MRKTLHRIAMASLLLAGAVAAAATPVQKPPTPVAAAPLDLLRAGRFAELDARMSAVQADWRRGAIDDLALQAAFRPFGIPDPALAARYDAWVAAFPKSYVARLAQGDYLVHVGREARGGAYAVDTPASQFKAMAADNALAEKALRDSLTMDARPLLSYSLLIDLTRHRHGVADARAWLDAGLKLDPRDYILRLRYMTTLESRWGGNPSAMQAFLDASRAVGLDEAKLRTLDAMVEIDRAWVADRRGDLPSAAHLDLVAVDLVGDGRFLDVVTYGWVLTTAAYAQERIKREDLACPLYARFSAITPESGWGWSHLGFCQAKTGAAAASAQSYQRGAELGDAFAQNEWGKVLWFGIAPTPVDRVAATAWFAKAAATGLPDAVNNLTWARKQQAGSR